MPRRNAIVALAVGALLLVGGLYRYATLNVSIAAHTRNDNDFKHLYAGVLLVAQGQSPYDRVALQEMRKLMGANGINPYVYLPFTAQAMRPLTWGQASLETAARRWFAANHVFLWAGLLLLLSAWPRRAGAETPLEGWAARAPAIGLAALGVLGSFAVLRTLTAGQLNLALFAGYALVYALLARGRDASAGVVAAFIALFKLAPGLLLVHFMLTRRWRAVAGMTIGGAAMLGVGMAAAGPRMYLDFLPLAREMSYGRSTWGDVFDFYRDPANQSLNSFFHHVLADNPPANRAWIDLGPEAADNATRLAAALVLGGLLLLGWRVGRERTAAPRMFGAAERALFAACVMGSLLLPSLMWDHYMTIAAVAWLVLLEIAVCGEPRGEARGGRGWEVALLLVLLGVVALGLGVYPVNYWAPEHGAGWGLLVRSARLWPSLYLWAAGLALAWKFSKSSAAPPPS